MKDRTLGPWPLWVVGCGLAGGAATAAGDMVVASVCLLAFIFSVVPSLGRGDGLRAAAFLCACAFAVGAVYSGFAVNSLSRLQAGEAALVELSGRVQLVQSNGDERIRLYLAVSSLGPAATVAADLSPNAVNELELLPGDKLSVRGRLQRPRAARNPYGFDERRYWWSRGVGLLLADAAIVDHRPGGPSARRMLARWRKQVVRQAAAKLSPSANGLLSALIFGDRTQLSPELEQVFRNSGTAHLLAVSGLHVGLLVAAVGSVLAPAIPTALGRWPLIAALASLFAAVAGAGPPVIRATVAALLVSAAPIAGRPLEPLNALGGGVIVTLFAWPLLVIDVRWQLSFLSVLGLWLLSGRLRPAASKLPAGRAWRWLADGLAAGTAALLAISPVLAAAFGELAWFGPVATLILLPVIAVALVGAAVWPAVQAICTVCSAPAAVPLESAAAILDLIAPWLSQIVPPLAVPTPPGWWAVGYYGILFATLADWRSAVERRRLPPLRPTGALALFVSAVSLLLLLGTAAALPKQLELTMLDVGQGDALLLGAPGGRWAVIDTGRNGRELVAYLRGRGIRRLEWLAVTHGHADHYGGLDRVLTVRPDTVVVTVPDQQLTNAPTEAVRQLTAGDRLTVGSANVDVLSPPATPAAQTWSVNDRSLVLAVNWAGWRLLLTGDVERTGENSLLAAHSNLRAHVLKVAHHGSNSSNSADFLAAVRPELALIPVGVNNSYGHPHQSVLERLRQAGAEVRRTDLDGAVVVRFGRHGLSVENFGPDGRRRVTVPIADRRKR